MTKYTDYQRQMIAGAEYKNYQYGDEVVIASDNGQSGNITIGYVAEVERS